MDVVMVTNNALEDKVGGHERYVRELAGTLVGRGHRVTLVAKRWSADQPARDLRPDGVVIERYPVPAKSNPLFAVLYPLCVLRGVARSLRAHPTGVVHAHMGLPALGPALRRIPFVFTFHAPVWRELLSERQGTYILPAPAQRTFVGALRAVEGFVARRSAATVVLSEFMRAELGLLDEATARTAYLIPGGIDADRFSPDGDVRQANSPVTLFTARRLTPRTGVDELIRAMPLIREQVPGAQLKVAGTGPQRQQLDELVSALRMDTSIEFLGRVSDDDLVRRYRQASLVVLPTRELEGFGLTTAEALACGAAVVGTPAGATPELLRPLDPDLVATDVSARAIATAVVALVSDPERLARIRARARATVLPSLSWDAVADRYLELYSQVIRT